MSDVARCRVKGCVGVLDIRTNGHGGTVETCACCEKRSAWERQNVPKRSATCGICGGTTQPGPRGRAPKLCDACRPLMVRAKSAGYKEVDKSVRALKRSVA